MVWLTELLDNPAFRGLVIRRNADDLSDWIDRAARMYARLGVDIAYHPAVLRFPSGAIIRTGHLKDDNAYTKYQGHEYHRILIEELTQIPNEKSYLQLISSCRTSNPELKPQIFATTNPGNVGHIWVKNRFVDVAPPDTRYFDPVTKQTRIYIPATVDDNPTLVQNDPTYLTFLDGLKSTDEELWKAWRLGEWDVFSGMFFREFRRDLHTCRPVVPKKEAIKIGGIDWGYTASFVFLAAAIQRVSLLSGQKFLRLWIFKEIQGTEKTPEQWARRIRENVNLSEFNYIRADPAVFHRTDDGSKSIADQMKDVFSEYAHILKPANNDRVGGWAYLRKWLSLAPDGLPYLIISNNCTELIRTLPLLIHDEHDVEDVDTESPDHCADSLRYLCAHIKWIDGNVGGVNINPTTEKVGHTADTHLVDLGKFETVR